jgi:hypothetical protein
MARHSNPPSFRPDSLLAMLFLASTALLAQPSLRITSPADKTEVHPGQSLQVKVVPSGTFRQVVVIPWKPIRYNGTPRTAPPWDFPLHIPDHVAPGPYLVTAVGGNEPGQVIPSVPITLQVEEPADSSMRLDVEFHFMELRLGDTPHLLDALGLFPGDQEVFPGNRVVLNQSMYISFQSTAPGAATVDQLGNVTAVAPGTTKIIVAYRDSHAETSVTVLPKLQ